MKDATIIAEIGCNHKGDINIAKEFINVARDFCKVNVVKFQKRKIDEVLTPEEYETPHPVPYNSYGETYGKHREFLEFSIDQHRELKDYCGDRGMVYGCSVWDMTSLKEIISLDPEFIKIPSAANTHYELLKHLCENYSGMVHISFGMTTKDEECKIIDFFEQYNKLNNLIIYACTSGYPVSPEDVCLLEIKRLGNEYGDKVHAIGFSGHHNGISLDIAAYTLGAEYIERHFTLDRTWKGTDHAASLEPDGLRRLNRDMHNVKKALNYKSGEILEVEIAQRKKLKWDRNYNS
jgi:sialic acid synthase